MGRNFFRAALAALLVLAAPGVMAQVVISQVYGGAGCGTAGCSTYKNDYIELFNSGSSGVSVNGWSVQYASATGTTWQRTNLPNVTIPAGGYFLVAQGSGSNGVNNIPAADATGTIAMSATAGKVALVNSTTTLSGSCPSSSIVDFVGYGSTANCNEGGANAPAPSTTNAVFRASAGCTDSGSNSSDFSAAAANPRNSSSAANSCNGGSPTLNINDVSQSEGDSGTVTFSFTVSLSSPAGSGGVSFDIATADGTATTADNDYVGKSLTSQTIAQGNSSYTFDVIVNGDTTVESNKTFFVNIDADSISGATAGDVQGLGTINNDDVTVTLIHDVQGNAAKSPMLTVPATIVTVRGIVTAVTGNGYFVQEEDADADADVATSEGIFVFTSSAPPAGAAVGNQVQVTGTVAEYVSSSTPYLQTYTELTSATTVQMSAGNTLPSAVDLNTALAGADYQNSYPLEAFEGMRVSSNDLDVVAPSDGSISEANATVTSDGTFFAVIGGVDRPFREEGIAAGEVSAYVGYIGPVFDENRERIRVRSRGQAGSTNPLLDPIVGDAVTNVTGVLDVFAGNYTILPDHVVGGGYTGPQIVDGPTVPTAARAPAANEITISGANLLRLFDTSNDPQSDPVLTATAFKNRIAKDARVVCQMMQSPDIIGTVEVEKLGVLQSLATAIDDTANSGCASAPNYQAYLVEGNDPGGIDVGFMVKTGEVAPGQARVTVNSVTQEGLCTLFKDASGNDVTAGGTASNGCAQNGTFLNDRPSLVLDATIHAGNGSSEDVTVIVNHLRSLGSVNSTAAGSNGYATEGARVRAKRQQQAEYLASLVQDLQDADPFKRIVLVGDFNAFQFNDGYGDSMGVIAGEPAPDNETVVSGDGIDLVDPNLSNLTDSKPADERYSFVFDGSAQSLDHALANQNVFYDFSVDSDHARINADFPVILFADFSPGSVARVSDHDPVIVYLGANSFLSADLYVNVSANASPILPGTTAGFSVVAGNDGADTAPGVKLDFSVAVNPSRVSLVSPAGWTCGAPTSDGGGGTLIHCTRNSFAVGSDNFIVNVTTTEANASTQITLGAAINASSTDTQGSNNTDSASVTLTGLADVAATVVAPTTSVNRLTPVTFKTAIGNQGISAADLPTLEVRVGAPVGVVRALRSQTGNLGCSLIESTASLSRWLCSGPGALLPGRREAVLVDVQSIAGWNARTLKITAIAATSTPDKHPENNTATASAPVSP
jgi:hypothetical protein